MYIFEIYIKFGDRSKTSLIYVSKVNDCTEAYGINERANSMIGLALLFI
ncbi:hypothetical protein [Peribacillus sp. Hz7]